MAVFLLAIAPDLFDFEFQSSSPSVHIDLNRFHLKFFWQLFKDTAMDIRLCAVT